MSPVQEFSQLAAQGDLRGIKRLYARQLKLTRPDDDALAFQQLHHAFAVLFPFNRPQAKLLIANHPQWTQWRGNFFFK